MYNVMFLDRKRRLYAFVQGVQKYESGCAIVHYAVNEIFSVFDSMIKDL